MAPGYRLAQGVHAAIAFALQFPELARAHETVVCLVARDEDHLLDVGFDARLDTDRIAWFHEPDLDGQLTAIALIPGAGTQRVLRRLPLDSGGR